MSDPLDVLFDEKEFRKLQDDDARRLLARSLLDLTPQQRANVQRWLRQVIDELAEQKAKAAT